MPLEVTLISLEKVPPSAIVSMGQPASNTPMLERNDAVNLTGPHRQGQ